LALGAIIRHDLKESLVLDDVLDEGLNSGSNPGFGLLPLLKPGLIMPKSLEATARRGKTYLRTEISGRTSTSGLTQG
jgi:hypothetical protein